MGRCNNRRVQQAALASRNTPSRARFSKGPPGRNNNTKRTNGRGGGGRGGGGRGGRDGRGRGTGTTTQQKHASVIEKLSRRVEEKSTTTTTTTTTAISRKRRRHPLAGVDRSKLDEIKLSEESMEQVTKLLQDLGVILVPSSSTTKLSRPKQQSHEFKEGESDNVDADENDARNDGDGLGMPKDRAGSVLQVASSTNTASAGYHEYDDDVGEEEYGTAPAFKEYYANDNTLEDNIEEDGSNLSQDEEDDGKDDHGEEEVRRSTLFQHLTQTLSFSDQHALQAFRGIEYWAVSAAKNNDDDEDTLGRGRNVDHKERLALAMDWLCLHLTEQELERGFVARPSRPLSSSSAVSTSRTISARSIPHPSISIAKPLTSDQEWKDSIRKQAKVTAFLRMGFSYAEAEAGAAVALKMTSKEDHHDIELEPMRIMMRLLEEQVLGKERYTKKESKQLNLSAGDLEFAKQEREQEVEALQAIYEDQFQVSVEDIHYRVQIQPADEEARSSLRSSEFQLEVLIRPGYPVTSPPFMLLRNSTMPPTLLRRINVELIEHLNDESSLGEPAVFMAVDFLSNEIPTIQQSFIKEQRRREMEAEQIRMRKEAGHPVNEAEAVGALDSNDQSSGRRQRAKLKAKEKAYVDHEELQRREAERKEKQRERLDHIHHQDRNLRSTLSNQTVTARNKQRAQEEAEQAARRTMVQAFNQGATTEEARRRAEAARRDILRFHGEDVGDDNVDVVTNADPPEKDNNAGAESTADSSAENDDDSESKPTEETSSSSMKRLRETTTSAGSGGGTNQTRAFMERLREVYKKAAQEKQQTACSMANVSDQNSSQESNTDGKESKIDIVWSEQTKNECGSVSASPQLHIPSPIPIATGDLSNVMKDVIAVQKEQPWLVSEEARVPHGVAESNNRDTSTLTQDRARDEKSIILRKELVRKRADAERWAQKIEKNKPLPSGNNRGGPKAAQYHRMMSQRERLPAFKMKEEIVTTIALNQVCVVSAETGAGKTTQVPQLVLDELIMNGKGAETNMIVTQPRRISAIGVAERVAAERCERVGETVGYSIRLENKRSEKTRILLCTTGILLRRLQCDPDLAAVSHIFVDEVHERDLNTDFLLIILKDLLARRKSLKLILMSATLNAEAFSKYFGECPVVSIPGRAHPVQENRLEDVLHLTGYEVDPDSDYAIKPQPNKPPRFSKSMLRKMYYPKYSTNVINALATIDESLINYELLASLLEHITLNTEQGAILVFMPGMMEITKTIEELYKKEFFQTSQVSIYPLHSSLSTAEQTSVFEVPPEGVRKIVVATNIAETSITIEDVVYVVDSGKVKENRKDEVNEMPTLVETWVSRASAKQRRGRAGRVRPGIAYHMYSSHTHEQDMLEYQLPEMLRVGLEDLVLQIMLLDLGEPTTFLSKAVDPPSAQAMKNSLKLLESLGAVEVEWTMDDTTSMVRTQQQNTNETAASGSCDGIAESGLTALGFHLATLPVDPRVGKMMIYGGLFGCTDPALTIAASMSARSPFVSPFDKRDQADEARKLFAVDGSDHLTSLKAFQEWKRTRQQKGERATQTFLRDHFLSRLTLFQMDDLRRQFADLLKEIGFLQKDYRVVGSTSNGRRKGGGGRGGQRTHTNGGQQSFVMNSADMNSDNLALVKAILCAGLYPNIIVAPRSLVPSKSSLRPGLNRINHENKTVGECAFQSPKGETYLHPCTISFSEHSLSSRYCCYHDMVKTKKVYVRDCTAVSEFALLLFGGSLQVYHKEGVVTVDEWLKFRVAAKPATLVKHLRAQMESMLLKKIVNPSEDVTGSKEGQALIQAVSMLLERERTATLLPDGAEIVRPWHGSGADQNRTSNGNSDRGRGRNGYRGGGGGRGAVRGRGASGRGRRNFHSDEHRQ